VLFGDGPQIGHKLIQGSQVDNVLGINATGHPPARALCIPLVGLNGDQPEVSHLVTGTKMSGIDQDSLTARILFYLSLFALQMN
jgi:hypothetical protein